MLTSKIKKIISFSFLMLFLVSLIIPLTSSAQGAPTLEVKRVFDAQQGNTGMHRWVFDITTTNVPDETLSRIVVMEKQTNGTNLEIFREDYPIKNNAAETYTPFILKTGVTYGASIGVTVTGYPLLSKNFFETVPTGGEPPIVVGGNPGQGSSPGTTQQSLLCFPTNNNPNDGTVANNTFWFRISASEVGAIRYKGPYNTELECKKAIQNIYYNTITPTTSGAKTNLDYYPLAPLPGVGETCEKDVNGNTVCIKTGPDCKPDPTDPTGKKQICTPSNAFGKYLNMMIQIFIGLAAVLAMIMIVMGGIEYMTSELVSSKQAGKDRIINAILGLLLALGSYAILNTLNPDLLNVGLGNLPEATIALQDEEETTGMTTSSVGTPPSGSYGGCKEGFEQINTKGGNFYLCKKISADVKKLIDLAWSQNSPIKLSGGSYRSKQDQEKLRAQHCVGEANIYNKNAKCSPPTAFPGTSRHESGLAIDFTCDGVLIQAQDNKCFIWLSQNANNYKLFNFKKEPWHWSVDGH